MAKLGKNEDVRVEVLVKICRALNCTLMILSIFYRMIP
ncbi:MAG: helix-turn-helix domain-containing protein [Oscillospiraceae bacterium]